MVNHQFQDLTTTLGALLEDLLPTWHPMLESTAALRCTAWLPIHRPGSRHMPHWNDRYGIAFLPLALGPSGAELVDWSISACLGGVWSGVFVFSLNMVAYGPF